MKCSDPHLDHVGIEGRTQHGRHQTDVVGVQVGLVGREGIVHDHVV